MRNTILKSHLLTAIISFLLGIMVMVDLPTGSGETITVTPLENFVKISAIEFVTGKVQAGEHNFEEHIDLKKKAVKLARAATADPNLAVTLYTQSNGIGFQFEIPDTTDQFGRGVIRWDGSIHLKMKVFGSLPDKMPDSF